MGQASIDGPKEVVLPVSSSPWSRPVDYMPTILLRDSSTLNATSGKDS
jgi:hypothetical protein